MMIRAVALATVLGALIANWARGLENDVFFQVTGERMSEEAR